MPGDDPDELPGNQKGQSAIRSIDELAESWSQLDERWDAYLRSLTSADLSARIAKVSTSSGIGRRHSTPAFDILLHLCTHAQYTLAQGINMLRHLGVDDLPDVMLITMSRGLDR